MSLQNNENPDAIIKEEINRVMEDTETTVHEFDPDASPEEKAKKIKENSSIGLPTADANSSKITPAHDTTTSVNLPGALPHLAVESASEIPDWARVGWKNVMKIAEDSEKTIYDDILGELYFGQLWLNATVVFVAVFATYFVTLLGGGLGWVIIICAFVATYFKNSVQRFYRNARSDIARELAKERLETDEETTEWINEFLRRFWIIYEPVLSATIVQIADGILLSSTPSFLDSIRLSTFTLGTKAPIVESVKSYPKTDDDIVVMDWKVSFNPNDVANMTRAQITRKINPKIVLTVRVGRGMVGAGIPVLLEDISFSGHMKVRLKLVNTFPHVKTIDLSFLQEPKIDYILKPIGGETFGFDIGIIPGLSDFIRNQIHSNLRPMLYSPNMYTLDVDSLIGGYPIESGIGVLDLHIVSARNLRNLERFGGTSDPYVKLMMLGRLELGRTRVIDDDLNPVWDENRYLVLNSLNDVLKFEIFDANEFTSDRLLGTATLSLNSLNENPTQRQVVAPVLAEGKQYGEFIFDAIWYPVAQTKEGEPVPESNVGILRFVFHQAKDLDTSLSLVGQYNPYAELLLNEKPIFRTKTLKRTNNPIWEDATEVFVTNRKGMKIAAVVRDSRDFTTDPIIGSYKSTLDGFLKAIEARNDWIKVQDAPSGKLRLSCQWKPILIENPLEVAIHADPIGIVKLQIKKAENLKMMDHSNGKFNSYVRVSLLSNHVGRTQTIRGTQNPTWNENFYIPVHNEKEIISIEVFYVESSNYKDKRIGTVEFNLKDLIKVNENNNFEAGDVIDTSKKLSPNDGTVYYYASFHPMIPLKNATITAEETEKKDNLEEQTGKVGTVEDTTDILNYKTGILIVKFIRANIERKDISLELYVDSDEFPAHTTNRSKIPNPQWNEVAEIFVKELDYSRIRLNVKSGDDKKPIGTSVSNVKTLIEGCLTSTDGVWLKAAELRNAQFNISVNYFPVKYELDFSESIKNMGRLLIAVESAKISPEIGKTGSVDAFLAFILNDERVFKSKTIKNSLNPVFNDKFETTIHSRINADLKVEVIDWNQVKTDEKLAVGKIPIVDLEPLKQTKKEIPLTSVKDSKISAGTAYLNLLFIPELLDKKKRHSGAFDPRRTITGIGSTAISGGTNIVGSGINLVGNLLNRKNSDGSSDLNKNEVDLRSIDRELTDNVNIVGIPGTLTLSIPEATDLIPDDMNGFSDPYFKVRVNDKEIFKSDTIKKTLNPQWKSYTSQIPDLTGRPLKLHISVKNYNLVGKDGDIGEYELDLWEHIKPDSLTKDMWVDLKSVEKGQLHIKLDYKPKNN